MSLVITVQVNSELSHSPIKSNELFRWIDVGQTLVVGRSHQYTDLCISGDQRMSNQHFQLECRPDGSFVRDLKSTNGTTLNTQPVDEARLQDEDRIVAGDTEFHIHLPKTGGIDASIEIEVIEDIEEPEEVFTKKDDLLVTTAFGSKDIKRADGWDIELNEWPEPLSAEVQMEVFDQQKNRSNSDAKPTANVVLMIHDECQTAQQRMVSRAIAWIGPDQSLIVGRSPMKSDWALTADHYLSGSHFQVSNESGICRLENLSATNGTWVNGNRVKSTLLRDQDLIRAGQTVLQVGIDGGVKLSDVEVRKSMLLDGQDG